MFRNAFSRGALTWGLASCALVAACSAPAAKAPDAGLAPSPALRGEARGIRAAHTQEAPARTSSTCVIPPQRGASEGLEVEAFAVSAEAPGLACCAYLRRSAWSKRTGSADERIALFENGTGIYTTAHGDLDGIARGAAHDGRFAILSFDKPGIGATSEGLTTVDRSAFDRHTMGDLVACTKHAIATALARPHVAPNARVLAHGHSEGAQVWVRALASARSGNAVPWSKRVSVSVLSGLPLEAIVTGAERQLGVFLPFEIEAFRKALAAHDDDYLVLLGMPWRYLEHPMAHEPTTDVLDRLAAESPGERIELFHGERDRNAPIEAVKNLVARNAKARAAGQAALDLRLHAYSGASHQLDARLDADLEALVSDLVSP